LPSEATRSLVRKGKRKDFAVEIWLIPKEDLAHSKPKRRKVLQTALSLVDLRKKKKGKPVQASKNPQIQKKKKGVTTKPGRGKKKGFKSLFFDAPQGTQHGLRPGKAAFPYLFANRLKGKKKKKRKRGGGSIGLGKKKGGRGKKKKVQ